jgi:hypothetical protein
VNITLSAKFISTVLTGIIGFLLIAHCIQAYFFLEGLMDYVYFLDFDIERNLPTFYSVAAIEIAALLLLVIYIYHKKNQNNYQWAWLGLSILFAFLGLDEATKIHENAGDIISYTFEATGIFYFPWVLPYGIALIFLSVIYIPWLFSIPLSNRIEFIISAIVFLSGALGMEMLSAVYAEQTSLDSYEYIRTYTIEETLEMLGVLLFIRALIRYMHVTIKDITIECRP